MAKCRAQEWFVGGERECATCGRGPCPRSFNLPSRTDYTPQAQAAYLEIVQAQADRRRIINHREVARRPGSVPGFVSVLYEGEKVDDPDH